MVLFGGSGDLSLRMLFPSLYFLARDGLLPNGFRILAVSRSISASNDFRDTLKQALVSQIPTEYFDAGCCERFLSCVETLELDLGQKEDFVSLGNSVRKQENAGVLYYLATSPGLYGATCHHLQSNGLVDDSSRVVLEKPVGYDLKTSRDINDAVGEAFSEDAIYRVDHYLGKETVQNLLALRFANFMLEPLWNRNAIEHVQITVSETVGVEGRWTFYNETGALRDMVQNHMLQLLCLVAMEAPGDMGADAVHGEKVKVLRALRPVEKNNVKTNTVRGQYAAGASGGKVVPGYSEEAGGEKSECETFVALRCEIDNWRWAGVPFYLRTGKRLPQRYTEVFIQFRAVPHSIYPGMTASELKANSLIIRLQPEEYIRLIMMNKVPGLTADGIHFQPLPLNLSWTDAFQGERRRIAYERLILDAIQENKTLFVQRDEVETAWSWVDGVIDNWQAVNMLPQPYVAGTWGPSSAFALTERNGHTWHE